MAKQVFRQAKQGETWERVVVNLDLDLLAWIDREAASRDRSRAWLVNHICRMYRRQLERDRQRRAERRTR